MMIALTITMHPAASVTHREIFAICAFYKT
jgi:hypothetical protein